MKAMETAAELSPLELMGHLYRHAGFGATRDELDTAVERRYEATLDDLLHPERAPDLEEDLLFRSFPDFHETRKVDVAHGRLYVAEHSRHRVQVYERD